MAGPDGGDGEDQTTAHGGLRRVDVMSSLIVAELNGHGDAAAVVVGQELSPVRPVRGENKAPP